ncbi:unnamed protein product, partial [Ectocarpus fasciculatus]
PADPRSRRTPGTGGIRGCSAAARRGGGTGPRGTGPRLCQGGPAPPSRGRSSAAAVPPPGQLGARGRRRAWRTAGERRPHCHHRFFCRRHRRHRRRRRCCSRYLVSLRKEAAPLPLPDPQPPLAIRRRG